MSELSAIAAAYRDLIARCEVHLGDHSPGAIWRRAERASRTDAPRTRAWKARAIGLNPTPLHNAIALSGMAPLMFEERWHLAVALPQPAPGDLITKPDDVILIDPKANTAQMLGDIECPYVAPRRDRERLEVFTDAKGWARALALDRLEWFNTRVERRRLLQAEPTWTGDIPAALLLSSPKKIRWSDFRARVIEVPAELRADVHRAVFAQAALPRIEGRA